MKIIRKIVFMVGESGGHIVMLEFKMVNERGYGDMELFWRETKQKNNT